MSVCVFQKDIIFDGMLFEEKNVEGNLREIQVSVCKLGVVFSILSNWCEFSPCGRTREIIPLVSSLHKSVKSREVEVSYCHQVPDLPVRSAG